MPVCSIAVTGLPLACPHCEHEPPARPLRHHALEVTISCPARHHTISRRQVVPN